MSTSTPKPPEPYKGWADLLLDRAPLSSSEFARPENGISSEAQRALARSELAALRAENESLRGQVKATDAARDRVFKAMSEVDYENGKLRAWAEAGTGSFDFGKVYSELLTAQADRDSLRAQLARCREVLEHALQFVRTMNTADTASPSLSNRMDTLELKLCSALEAKP